MSTVEPTLFAPAATVRALAGARAVAVLVGGYDGSGNYGDIALLEAARSLVDRLGPGLLALPLLERSFLEDHRALSGGGEGGGAETIFFDPEGGAADDLQPVAAPAELAFGACYLYGGGYLNRSWGDRKLAMLRAAEALLEAGGAAPSCRLASGLQAEAGWIAGLGEEDAGLLRSFDFLGARDGSSAEALAALGGPAPAATGDDAIGVLARLPVAEYPDGERLLVNVHFAEHDWVSERPGTVLDFCAGLLAELGRVGGRPVAARPLIAYRDRRVDERAAIGRLAEACSARGIETAEPLLLRPAGLAAAAPRLSEASLTVSCSYHVALTSLMLAVPAVLLGDNPYYAQKAAGLAEDFELPPAFTPAASADPAAAAAAIAGAVLGGTEATAFRRHLAAGASRLRQRRAGAETELLGRLGGSALEGLDGRLGELAERLRQRSAEPAALQAQLAERETELEELRQRREESPLEAELLVQEAEERAAAAQRELAAVLGSRSWRLAAPLRRVGALFRRRR